ncbi:MAG: helix-turn-helix domain-containing protein [Candidatus Riflebacteria bacterium]|nr:helix-turn-helix domain-containing protein [Candidatus Riflebacteria bacterium]
MNLSEIGIAIRTARKKTRMTQDELGRILGMSRATISGIETGNINEIGIRKIIALLAVLGLELFVGQKQRYPTLQQLRRENHEKKQR